MVRCFALLSATLIFTGITLLTVAVSFVTVNPSDSLKGDRRWQLSAGIFTLGIIPFIIIPAVVVRIKYAEGRSFSCFRKKTASDSMSQSERAADGACSNDGIESAN